MKGIGKVILLILSLVSLLSLETRASTSTQSYFFKNSVLKPHQNEYIPLLLAQQMTDSTITNKMVSPKMKSPYIAIFCSVVPGIIIHGSGHFYAGRTKTGFLLLGSEVVGIGTLFLSALSGFAASESGDTGAGENADFMGLVGFVLFAGSWVYDVVGSPLVVQKQNQELLQRKNTGMKFQLKDGGLRLAFVYHF